MLRVCLARNTNRRNALQNLHEGNEIFNPSAAIVVLCGERTMIKKLWKKFIDLNKWILAQLKDWKTFVLFLGVCAVMSVEVWLPYILGFVTGNKWWFGIGSACWLFWIGPGTPFIPLCIAITLAIKKLFFRKKDEKK